MAEDGSDSDDQLDEFIHSYSYSDDDARARPSSDEEDTSCSDSVSEPPEDASAEQEDMALYDLYDNSARPSPHPPSSPKLQEARLELDSVLDVIEEDSKSPHPERRERPRTSFAPSSRKSGDLNSAPGGDSSESDTETSDDEDDRE